MKTPTNFIPIIGPLYADDLQSVAQRSRNLMSCCSVVARENDEKPY